MKWFGATKDMALGNFGRQVRLFEPLAKRHKVDFFCPDYTKREKKVFKKNSITYFIEPVSFFLIPKLLASLEKIIKNKKYDVIVGTTDPLLGILANKLSKKYKTKFVYDLQDNFEIYSSCRIPFVRHLDHKAVREADLVITVSDTLRECLRKYRKKPMITIQNGIEKGIFRPMDRKKCRAALKLPQHGKIIAYIGHISNYKGFDVLFKAFQEVRKEIPDTFLLLSGKVDYGLDIKKENVVYSSLPERKQVAMAINAADVCIIPNTENEFSKYCFPYKLLEYMACDVPIVASDIGDVGIVLKKYGNSLFRAGGASDLAEKIKLSISAGRKISYKREVEKFRWNALSSKMEKAMLDRKL